MKKSLRWSIVAAGVLLLVAVVAFVCRDIFLKRLAERRIQERTGLRAQIGSLKSGLRSTSFFLRDVKLYNRADFGGLLMLDMPELFIALDARAAAEGKLHIRELRIRLKELNILQDEQGRMNVDQIDTDLLAREPARSRTHDATARPAPWEFAGIDLLILTIGRVRFTNQKKPSLNFDIDLGLRDERFANLKTNEEIGSKLFRLIVTVAMKAGKPGQKGRFEVVFDSEDDATTNAPPPLKPSP